MALPNPTPNIAPPALDTELAALERKQASLIAHTRALRAANEALRRDLAAASARNQTLAARVAEARERARRAPLPPARSRGMSTRPQAGGERTVTLDVSLLGRDFKVACKESERAELGDAVALLDRRMREIREGGKIAGAERIAVMAALNLAHDLLRERRQTRPTAPSAQASSNTNTATIDDAALRRRIESMHSALDAVLTGQSD